MRIKILTIKIFATAAVCLLLVPAAGAVNIFLKNGKIHEGKITANTRAYVILRNREGKRMRIPKRGILRISYRDLYRGKFYVRLYDGTDFLAYRVDENTNGTVFRKKLYVNREFTLPADSIQFTTRTNPTDLKGVLKKNYVRLSWNPPFNPVEGYRVYVKTPEGKKYTFVAFTRKNRYDLRHLQSRTVNSIIVKAVDKKGDESLPSNSVKVKTGTLPPLPPRDPGINKKPEGALITWKPDNPWNRDRSYRVYGIEGASHVKKGETEKKSLVLKGIDFKTKQDFFVRSVDRHGDESADSRVISTLRGLDFYLLGAFSLPLRDFDSLHKPGGGYVVGAVFNNIGIYNLFMGVETSFFYFKGRENNINNTMLLPLYYVLGYHVALTKRFSLEPFFCMGGSLNIVSRDAGSTNPGEKKVAFEFMPRAGINCTFALNDFFSLRVRGTYGGLIEREGFMDFVTVDCGVSWRLYF